MLADIMKAALKYADRPAFVIEDETYTYSRLVGQAISISHTLRNLKENVVGIAAEKAITDRNVCFHIGGITGRKDVCNPASRLSCGKETADSFGKPA